MENARILAVDYGAKNVGLASSDESGIAIRPLESIPNRSRKDLIARLRAHVELLGIGTIVIGIPWNMDGTAGDAVRKVERFIQALSAEVSLPILRVDERLSTAEAAEIWHSMPPRRQRKYRTIDSLAAALILKRYIEEG